MDLASVDRTSIALDFTTAGTAGVNEVVRLQDSSPCIMEKAMSLVYLHSWLKVASPFPKQSLYLSTEGVF